MNVLIINGSPKAKKSNTEKIVAPFISGIKDGGAAANYIYLNEMNIIPCTGCLTCFFQGRDMCVYKDDFPLLAETFDQSDIVVFSSPIYGFGLPAKMKAAYDKFKFRMWDSHEIKLINGKCCYLSNKRGVGKKFLLILNASFDMDFTFKPTIDMIRYGLENSINSEGVPVSEFLGSINIGFGNFLSFNLLSAQSEFFKQMYEAGVELATKGTISQTTIDKASRPLYEYMGIDREKAVHLYNQYVSNIKKSIDEKFKDIMQKHN